MTKIELSPEEPEELEKARKKENQSMLYCKFFHRFSLECKSKGSKQFNILPKFYKSFQFLHSVPQSCGTGI